MGWYRVLTRAYDHGAALTHLPGISPATELPGHGPPILPTSSAAGARSRLEYPAGSAQQRLASC
jgi:hypothetical protein